MQLDLRLYALLDPEHASGRKLDELARMVAEGGATLVQLRDKQRGTRTMIEDARAIKSALAAYGVPLVINDRVDVALAAGADGVHVGQDDMPVEDVRRLVGRGGIVGFSIKNAAQAEAAPFDLLDYVGVGGVFPTSSKTNTDAPIGVTGLAHLAAAIRRRSPRFAVCAIAGIDMSNAAATIEAGADGIAVISAISLKPDPMLAARELRAVVDTALAQRRQS